MAKTGRVTKKLSVAGGKAMKKLQMKTGYRTIPVMQRQNFGSMVACGNEKDRKCT